MKNKKLSDKAKAKRIATIKAVHLRKGKLGNPEEPDPDFV